MENAQTEKVTFETGEGIVERLSIVNGYRAAYNIYHQHTDNATVLEYLF